jgi:hypothetical protein
MLIALMVTYFALHFGAGTASPLLGDPSRLESSIQKQVPDQARLAQLNVLVVDLKAADKEAASLQDAAVKAVDRIAARHATTAAELEAALDTLEAGQRNRRDRQMALRLQLAALTTPEEFAAILAQVLPASPAPAARR